MYLPMSDYLDKKDVDAMVGTGDDTMRYLTLNPVSAAIQKKVQRRVMDFMATLEKLNDDMFSLSGTLSFKFLKGADGDMIIDGVFDDGFDWIDLTNRDDFNKAIIAGDYQKAKEIRNMCQAPITDTEEK